MNGVCRYTVFQKDTHDGQVRMMARRPQLQLLINVFFLGIWEAGRRLDIFFPFLSPLTWLQRVTAYINAMIYLREGHDSSPRTLVI